MFAPQTFGDVDECGGVYLTVAESIGLLTTPWRAETATADGLELVAAHRADRQRLAIVTRIVTHGVRAHAATACGEIGSTGVFQKQLTILELVAGQQQPELVGSVDATPVQAQPRHQLEDQVERVLPHPHPLGGLRAQSDAGEDGLDRVAGAHVHPMLLGEIVEGDEILPITLQAGSRLLLALGPQPS